MKKLFSILGEILGFYVFVGVIVGIHEYGHYREFVDLGIPLQEFSIGVGPKMFQVDGPSGMPINFRLLPLGGYVAPTDEGAEKFLQTHAGDQIQVMGAGILATLLVGMILIWFIYGFAWYRGKIILKEFFSLMGKTPYVLAMRCFAFLCSFFTLKRIDFSHRYIVSLVGFGTPPILAKCIEWCVYVSMLNTLPFYPLDGGKIAIYLLSYVGVNISPELLTELHMIIIILFVVALNYSGKQNLTVVKV